MSGVKSEPRRRPGRPTKGLSHIDALDGSQFAKERLRAILETLSGATSIAEGMERLDVSRTRFVQLRAQVLGAALAELEPKTPGRVPRAPTEAERLAKELESEIDLLRWEMQAAQVREEIATILPHRAAELATRSTPNRTRRA